MLFSVEKEAISLLTLRWVRGSEVQKSSLTICECKEEKKSDWSIGLVIRNQFLLTARLRDRPTFAHVCKFFSLNSALSRFSYLKSWAEREGLKLGLSQ